ncbi:transcription initiation factor TFIID component TAF4 family-domain-containing protein [Mycena amicta]|nr:transcription initiation factor TFIID component TAF4 family-domain-containing protein [Mycena amicta]
MASGIPVLTAADLDSLISFDSDTADTSSTAPLATTTTTNVITNSQAAAAAAAASAYQYQYHQYYSGTPQPTASYGSSSQASTSQSQSMARQAITNSAAAATSGGSGSLDTSDVATLNDALGSAGVDLRAEEESLQRSHGVQSYANTVFEDRARKQPSRPYFDTTHLANKMRTIATHHRVAGTGVSDDCVNYLALALRARLQDLVTAMISAAKHRTSAKFDRPASVYEDGTAAWGIIVRSDVAKQLVALEKAEREEEERDRELRYRRDRALDAALDAVLAGEDAKLEMPTEEQVWQDRRRQNKKRAVSSEVQREMTNRRANKEAGLPTRQWMTTTTSAKLPTATVTPTTTASPQPEPRPYRATGPAPATQAPDGKLIVSIRDARFVVGKERGHGGGRGAALGRT